MTCHSSFGLRQMALIRSTIRMTSPPSPTGMLPEIATAIFAGPCSATVDRDRIRQLVHVARAARKQRGQRVSQQLHGGDQAGRPLPAAKIAGHSVDDSGPE